MVFTHHDFKTVCLSSMKKRTHDSHSVRIYMLSNNVDLKTNNRNYKNHSELYVCTTAAINLFQVNLEIT